MAVFETYSKRQKKLLGDVPDVYTYDKFPNPLRVQLVQITEEGVGPWKNSRGSDIPATQNVYNYVVNTLRREYGAFRLQHDKEYFPNGAMGELKEHMLRAAPEYVLDALELVCRTLTSLIAASPAGSQWTQRYVDAIDEINHRFREHGVGFEFANGEILRIDSQLLHAEVVKPALQLLHGPGYEGAKEEFLNAYSHYRSQDNKEAVTNAAKAFESVMKVILSKRGWTHNATDPAKKLIAALIYGGLLPSYSENQLTGLSMLLEGIPTPRNKNAAHGQGAAPVAMSDEMTGYVLHMTASTIVFLVKAEQVLP